MGGKALSSGMQVKICNHIKSYSGTLVQWQLFPAGNGGKGLEPEETNLSLFDILYSALWSFPILTGYNHKLPCIFFSEILYDT